MTLEEKAEQFLTEKNIHDSVIWDKYEGKGWDLSILLEEFARQVAKAKLEEAAESLNNISIQQHIEQDCRHEDGSPAMDEQAFYEGAKWMRQSITKTPLD